MNCKFKIQIDAGNKTFLICRKIKVTGITEFSYKLSPVNAISKSNINIKGKPGKVKW